MKISIITVTYNSEKTLIETIDSIRKQQDEDLEYIIVDGGSSDNTLRIIKQNQDIITNWISEPDKGISDAFNKGIRMTTGEIIGIINSDDKLNENALKIVRSAFDDKTDILFGNCIYFGKGQRTYINKANPNVKELYNKMSIMHPATFIRKTAYQTYGMFNVDFKCAMDRELLLRMLTKGAHFKYIDKELAWYRVGGSSRRNVFTKTFPEDERISIMYGKSKVKAKIYSIKKVINLLGSEWLSKHPGIEKDIRKLLKKEKADYLE